MATHNFVEDRLPEFQAAGPIRSKSYRFQYATSCNMCGLDRSDHEFIGRRLDAPQGFWPQRKPGITTSIFRCRDCSLTYPDPMPLPESVAQHYDVLPTRYWSESYFTIAPNYVVYQVDGFRQMTGREPRGSIALDIGAGIGKAMVALERSGFETHGIEPSASFRQAALERFEISEDRLRLSSIEDADYPDGMFDFINFTAVLEHLPDPAAILRKTTRWLKPDGVMLVDVPSSSFLLSKLIRLFYHLTGNNFVINTCPMHVPYHLYEFGVESFRRNSRLGGYSVIHVDPNPCAEFVPRMLRPLSERVMRRTWTGMQLLVWLKRQ